MKPQTKAYIAREGGKLASNLIRVVMARPRKPSTESPEGQKEGKSLEELATRLTESQNKAPVSAKTTVYPQEVAPAPQEEEIAIACVPCAIGHYAGAARLLNEAIRFRDDGIESNQVLDDIAGAIGELNAMERVDLTPEKLQNSSSWERSIADEALRESRKLRHRLEGINSMEEIEKAAADTESYYKKLNRQWYKGRFAHLSKEKVEAIESRISRGPKGKPEVTLEEAQKIAAEKAVKEIERRWEQEKK